MHVPDEITIAEIPISHDGFGFSTQMHESLNAAARILRESKPALIDHWHAAVRRLPGAAQLGSLALRDHIPQFIDEMITAICRETEVSESSPGSPVEHGIHRLASGFDIKEVVSEYNILRGAVVDVIERAGLFLSGTEWNIIHHVIDAAIAAAVDAYATERATELQRRRDEHFAFIVHDVRTPLNAIALSAELLSESLEHDADGKDTLNALQRNLHRIDDLIKRVMDREAQHHTGGLTQPVQRDFDLWPLVQRLLQDLQPVTAAAHVTARNAVPRHITIFADATMLTRALQNLIGNAVKFSPGGSLEVGAHSKADCVECWVRDDGDGIERERLNRIFTKGETDPNPKRAGFGLGLAIFKQIVEAHGGTISVESDPGDGTIFRFTIPNRPAAETSVP